MRGIFIVDGSTPQISLAYSVIVLSLENLPEEVMFLVTFLGHSLGFCKEAKAMLNLRVGSFWSVIYNTLQAFSWDNPLLFTAVPPVGITSLH